jgi:hypothetical protein
MQFDPTKPAYRSPNSSQEMRDQLNALKALIDAQDARITALESALNGKASMDDVNAAIVANSAANVDGMEGLDGSPSDPPTQGDVLTLYYFGNNLLNALKRPS